MIDQINSEAFNSSYEMKPVVFHTANSPHFECKFAFRENDLILQFYPTYLPIRPEVVPLVREGLGTILGSKRDQAKVETISDEFLDQPSVFVKIDGFGERNAMKDTIATKLITHLHEGLSQGQTQANGVS